MGTIGAGFLLIQACSATPMRVVPPECDELGEACDSYADSANPTTEQSECHREAHEKWTAAQCTSNRSRCLAACPPPIGDGGNPDGGKADGGDGG